MAIAVIPRNFRQRQLVTLVQYREKTADDDGVKLAVVRRLCEICHRYDALLIVNDRVDLAIAANADGVHLGQQDLPVVEARRLLGPGRIIGRSTTSAQEMQRAVEEGADYIGVGPVYPTPTKPDKQAAGLDYVRYAATKSPIPWFAIGGIDINNLGSSARHNGSGTTYFSDAVFHLAIDADGEAKSS